MVLSPHVGTLVYAWFSLMNPHRLTFGFAYGVPFASIIAGLTLVAWMVSKERKLPSMNGLAWLLVAFTIWICITTFFAVEPEGAAEKFDRTIKIILGCFVTLVLIDRKERIIQLIAVVAFSIGYFGVKGGLFTILTAGSARIWGPPETMAEDNNVIALALVMVTPLVYYLSTRFEHPVIRWGLLATAGLCFAAILGTQSRGGLLALAAIGGLLWWRSHQKIIMGALLAFIVLIAGLLLADMISDRIDSMQNYQEDESAQDRLRAWSFGLDVALESPVTGGGFMVYLGNTPIRNGEPTTGYLNAHSIYFETLGEHGFVGLALFVGVILAAMLACSRLRKRTEGREDLRWAFDLGTALQVSVVGYAVGGTFLTVAFYDLFYYLLIIIIAADVVVARQIAEEKAAGHAGHPTGPGMEKPKSRSRRKPSPVRRRVRPTHVTNEPRNVPERS